MKWKSLRNPYLTGWAKRLDGFLDRPEVVVGLLALAIGELTFVIVMTLLGA